jgi:hypothetical protein
MTTEYAATLTDLVRMWRSNGVLPGDALRAAEIECGKNNEEFHPDGWKLVEGVYNGTFYHRVGGAGVGFIANPQLAVAPEPAPPTSSPEPVPQASGAPAPGLLSHDEVADAFAAVKDVAEQQARDETTTVPAPVPSSSLSAVNDGIALPPEPEPQNEESLPQENTDAATVEAESAPTEVPEP